MDQKTQWEALMWKAGQHLSQRLQAMLDDPGAQSITLNRDEAILALGIIGGAVETLEKGDHNR